MALAVKVFEYRLGCDVSFFNGQEDGLLNSGASKHSDVGMEEANVLEAWAPNPIFRQDGEVPSALLSVRSGRTKFLHEFSPDSTAIFAVLDLNEQRPAT